jgi:enoyl-CoA hydratase
MSEALSVEISDGVAMLTLTRPERRNAITIEMIAALTGALDSYVADPGVRCAVLTGAPPAFCAGLDLAEFSAADAPRHLVADFIIGLPSCPKPLIAAVNGAAYTGGLEVALACDFIIAGESALFADTHAKIGAMSASGMATRLSRAVGPRLAKQMMLTGRPIDARSAQRAGLVNEVVDDVKLIDRALEIATQIAGMDAEIATMTKDVVDRGIAVSLKDGLGLERDAAARHRAERPTRWKS